MIEIKKPINASNSGFTETVITLTTGDLNDFPQVKTFVWDGSIIIYATIQNNTDQDFIYIDVNDNNNEFLLHEVGTHSNSYSIVFAGNQNGQPNNTTKLSALNVIAVQWNFPGFANGELIIKIYSKQI